MGEGNAVRTPGRVWNVTLMMAFSSYLHRYAPVGRAGVGGARGLLSCGRVVAQTCSAVVVAGAGCGRELDSESMELMQIFQAKPVRTAFSLQKVAGLSRRWYGRDELSRRSFARSRTRSALDYRPAPPLTPSTPVPGAASVFRAKVSAQRLGFRRLRTLRVLCLLSTSKLPPHTFLTEHAAELLVQQGIDNLEVAHGAAPMYCTPLSEGSLRMRGDDVCELSASASPYPRIEAVSTTTWVRGYGLLFFKSGGNLASTGESPNRWHSLAT